MAKREDGNKDILTSMMDAALDQTLTSMEKTVEQASGDILEIKKHLKLYSSMTDEILTMCHGSKSDTKEVLKFKAQILNIIGAACQIGKV